MGMVFCRGCAQQIHDSAEVCPHCGARQHIASQSNEKPSIPDGVKGWSWGAFLSNWLWGIFNNTWIALLCFIPVVGIAMPFVLGVKGREWAWKNKKWRDLEHFQRVQRLWSVWSVGLTLGVLVIGLIGAVAIPAYGDYKQRARQAEIEKNIQKQMAEELQAKKAREDQLQAQVESETKARLNQEKERQDKLQATEPPPTDVGSTNQQTGQDPVLTEVPKALQDAKKCESKESCILAMLKAANPRNPGAQQTAINKLLSIEKNPNSERKLARSLNDQGLTSLSKGDIVAAAKAFYDAAQLSPSDAEIHSNLGLSYIKLKKPKDAISALYTALSIDPRRSSAWNPLADALEMSGEQALSINSRLLAYEYSGNKQRTIDYFTSQSTAEDATLSQKKTYEEALKIINSGY